MIAIRENCPMRHENGNCLPCGGFCTSVNDLICEALHKAYDSGYHNVIVVQEKPKPQKGLCLFWNPGHGQQRCEQIKWYACACNGDVDKCERFLKI